MKPVAYEGSEPYIFVSYAHRDSERVFEVLEELQKRGYRFWYDDGIAPGSEWPEDIAQHLDGSAMVIAFVTPNSMKSQNCRREINFSLSREKPFLSVLLEETDMPLGMQMQLSAQQSILRYNYDSWEGFVGKILACPDIAPCKAEEEPQPQEVAPVPVQQPEPAIEEPAPAAVVPAAVRPVEPVEEYHDVEVVPPVDEPVAEPLPEQPRRPKLGAKKRPKPAKQAEPAGKKLPIPLLAGAAALLIAIIAAVSLMTGGFTTSWGKKVGKGDTSISVTDEKVTQEDLEKIAGLKKLQHLSLEGCDLSECDFSQVSFASSELSEVSLANSTGVKSYAFLSDLSLKRLRLQGQEAFDDLSILDTSNLTELGIGGTGVTDLSPLEGTGVYDLDFSDTAVADISALATLGKLEYVDGSRSKVNSLMALRELTELRSLAFDGCRFGSLDKAFASLRLEDVSLADARVTSLDGFADCTVLKSLNLAGNSSLTSMDWLNEQNCATLRTVSLARTGLEADDLGWLAGCSQLTTLSLDGIVLSDLSACASLGNLEEISAVNCGIEDISGLAKCPKLLRVYLGCNRISDVSSLKFESTNPITLDLTGNQLATVEGLPQAKYRAIFLYANAADNVADTIPEGVEAYEVVTSYYEGVETGTLTDHERFTTVYVVDCPQNQLVKLQDTFGGGLKVVSTDELLDLLASDSFTYALNTDSGYLVSCLKGQSHSSSSSTGSDSSSDSDSGLMSIADPVFSDLSVGN